MKTNRHLILIPAFSLIVTMLFVCNIFADPDPSEHTVSVSPGTLINTNHWSSTIDDANPIIYFSADAEISSFSSQNARLKLTKIDSKSFGGNLEGYGSGGSKVTVNFTDGTALTLTLDFTDSRSKNSSSGGSGTASGLHNINIDNGTITGNRSRDITIDDKNPIIYFTSDYDVESFSSQSSRLLLSKIDSKHFKGELQGSQNAGCGIDVNFSDGTSLNFVLNITNNRTNTLSNTERTEMEAAAPSGPVQPAKFATLRSDGSLSCGSDNEWVLNVHSVARQPLFIDTTKPIKSVEMNGVPKFKYELVSSQCLLVYSQDPSVGRSFKINYTDGTSDEIFLRIDTDVVPEDDLIAFQETMFNAFIMGKQQEGYEICYTGEHLLAYQNIISADARSFRNQVDIDSNGVVVFPDSLSEIFFSYDISNGNFNTKSWFSQSKSTGSPNAFAFYSQKTNHWCIERRDKSIKALTFATCIGSSKTVDVVQIIFGDENINLVDPDLQEMIEGEEEAVILEEPKEIEISQTPLSEVKSLEIEVSEEVHISFDPKAAEVVSAANEEQPVNLVVCQKKTEEMNQAQIEILEDKDVQAIVSVELNTSESSIHSFEGGIATVSIPFIVPEEDNPEFYRVYYVSPEGKLTLVNSSYADGEISFSTFHFSDYAVIRSEEPLAEPEPAPEVKTEQPARNISSVYIAIAIGVVVILVACLAYKKIRK